MVEVVLLGLVKQISKAENVLYYNEPCNCDRPGTYSTSRITSKQIGKWKRELNQDEIYRVRKIVEQFNLPFYNSESDWK